MNTRPARSLLRHAVLILCLAVFAIPLYVAVVAASHSAASLLAAFPATPGRLLLQNLTSVLVAGFPGTPPVGLMLFNSLIMALGIAVGKLLISIPAAYAIVFFEFPGRMVVFWLIFITLLLPVEVRFFPSYEITAQLGLLNSFPGLIIPLIASATATFLSRLHFLTLPRALSDAARIDGVGPLQFLWKIVVPLSRPTLAALFVIEFVYGWNQYLWPLLTTSDKRYETIVMGMQGMISIATSFGVPRWDLVMAAALLALAPPVAVVLIMQRWFVRGITAGIS
jgi:sn-glycerol 3-phosphate transport system permease protein